MQTTISQRLRQARELGDLKARELDRLADISEGHTSLIESGARPHPESKTAMALAKTLGVSLDWFLLGEGKDPSVRSIRVAVDAARVAFEKREAEKKRTGTEG
jgi:transcriptional regulator with XRE-family HTH domain